MLTRSADFKMAASMREESYCVPEHAKSSSVTVVQRHYRTKFAKVAPHRHNITRWVKQLEETGCLCKGKSTGWPSCNNEVVENIRATTYEARGSLPTVPAENLTCRKRLRFKPQRTSSTTFDRPCWTEWCAIDALAPPVTRPNAMRFLHLGVC
jgi:hypothetical protein